jgi:hypothetical protein
VIFFAMYPLSPTAWTSLLSCRGDGWAIARPVDLRRLLLKTHFQL